MLETTADVRAHGGPRAKNPGQRLNTLRNAGELCPFTTGILVGIGEDWADRAEKHPGHPRDARTLRPHSGGHRPARRRERALDGRHARPRDDAASHCDGQGGSARRRLSPGPAEPRAGQGSSRLRRVDDLGGVSQSPTTTSIRTTPGLPCGNWRTSPMRPASRSGNACLCTSGSSTRAASGFRKLSTRPSTPTTSTASASGRCWRPERTRPVPERYSTSGVPSAWGPSSRPNGGSSGSIRRRCS